MAKDFSKLTDDELNAMVAAGAAQSTAQASTPASQQQSQQTPASIAPQGTVAPQPQPSRMEMAGSAATNIPLGIGNFLAKGETTQLSQGVESLARAVPQPMEVYEMGKSMLTQGGPVAIATNVASRVNPAAGIALQIAKPALIAVSGAFGRWLEGKRTGVEATTGQMVESGAIAPFIPQGALALIPPNQITGETAKFVTASVLSRGLQKGIDTGQALSPEEAAKTAAEAYAFFKGAQRLSTGTKQTELVARSNRASSKTETINNIIDEGYIMDPSLSNPSSRMNRKFIKEGGQSQFQELAASKNMENAASKAKLDLGIRDDLSLSPEVMEQRRETLSGAYRRAAGISPQAQTTLTQLNQARADSAAAWNSYSANTRDPSLLAEARRLTQIAEAVENNFSNIVRQSGNADLYDELRAVRPLMSKWHVYNTSLRANGGRGYTNGELDLGIIGSMHDPMRGNFTGQLRTMAELANIMPQVAESRIGKNPAGDKVATLKLMGLNIGSGAGAGIFLGSKFIPTIQMGEFSAPGGLVGALAGGLIAQGVKQPMVSALPEIMASGAYQRTMARPSFQTRAPEMIPSLLLSTAGR